LIKSRLARVALGSITSRAPNYGALLSHREYVLLAISAFFYAAGFYFFTWYLPILIMQEYGALYLTIIYVFGTAAGLLAVVSGIISDVFGYEYLIIGVPALIALSYAVMLLKQNVFTILFVAVAIHMMPLGGPPTAALVSMLSKEETLGMAFSLYRLAMLLGFTVSSSLLAVITQVLGLSLALLLGIIFISLCVLFRILVLRGVDRLKVRHRTEVRVGRGISSHITTMFKSLGICGAIALASMSIVNALVLSYGPFLYNFIRDVLGLSIALLGIYESLVTVVSAISQPVSGAIVDRVGRRAFEYAIYAEVVLSLLISALALLTVNGPPLLTAAALSLILLYELTGGVISNAIQARIPSLVAKDFRGSSYGLLTSLSSLIAMPIYPVFAYAWSVSPTLIPLSYGLLMTIPLIMVYVEKNACFRRFR